MRRPFQLRVGESVAAMAVYVARTITCTNFRLDGTFAMLRDDRSRWRAVFRRHIAVESCMCKSYVKRCGRSLSKQRLIVMRDGHNGR